MFVTDANESSDVDVFWQLFFDNFGHFKTGDIVPLNGTFSIVQVAATYECCVGNK